MPPPLGDRRLRLLRARAVAAFVRRFKPDVVIERYYNFGGEGIFAAGRLGKPAVLEVNAPMVDYPGSPKAALDKALVFEPMRRWRERLCADADLIVSPSAAILPAGTPPDKVLEVEWGADTIRFNPEASGPLRFARPAGILAVFAGAFQRIGVSPDGSMVAFEVTDDFALNSVDRLARDDQEGIYVVRADGDRLIRQAERSPCQLRVGRRAFLERDLVRRTRLGACGYECVRDRAAHDEVFGWCRGFVREGRVGHECRT